MKVNQETQMTIAIDVLQRDPVCAAKALETPILGLAS
jgi:hypothetical protein